MVTAKNAKKPDRDLILKELAEKTERSFAQARNCAQTTFAVLTDQFGLDDKNDVILKALAAFPGIAGRTETCGACSGSMLALGLIFAQQSFGRVRSFCDRFEHENGSTQCGEILTANLGRSYRFPEDFEAYLEDDGGKVCSRVIQNAVRIVGEIVLDS